MSVRPKIMKLARMIGGLPGMLNKLDENSPEYSIPSKFVLLSLGSIA